MIEIREMKWSQVTACHSRDIIPLLGSLAMSSSSGDCGGASTASEEGVIARYKTRFVVSAFSVGAIALAFEMSPSSAEETASKHGALIHVMRIGVAPCTLSILACRLSSFRVDDLTDACFDGGGG